MTEVVEEISTQPIDEVIQEEFEATYVEDLIRNEDEAIAVSDEMIVENELEENIAAQVLEDGIAVDLVE